MQMIDMGGAPADDALDGGAGGAVWLAAAVSALGGLLFGYDWVVIGGAKPFYEARFALTAPAVQAWAVSCALIGCLVGAMASGWLSERIGRRRSLLIAAVIFLVSALGTAEASGLASFVAWRIAGGTAIGMASGLSPLYIAEIAPARSRGKLVCLNQVAVVIGLLAAQIVNWLIAMPVPPDATMADIAASWNGTTGWRWMFAATAVPAAAFVMGCILIPESPRWLARRGDWQGARRVLDRLGMGATAERRLAEIREVLDAEGGKSVTAVLSQPRFRRVVVIGVVLAVLQQWCGINIIFNYGPDVFAAAGYPVSAALFNIVITGVVNCVFTFVAIATIEHWGRRRLLLLGCAGLAAIYVVLGACFLGGLEGLPLLLLIVAAIACYAMTLAPVTWVALAEIFPGEARGAGMAVATTALWAASFLLTFTFPLINAAAGTGLTFWLYAVICAGGLVFIFRSLPETKGKTLEQIEQGWTA